MVSLQADETEEFYETLGRDHVDTDTVADLKMTSCHYCVTGSHGKCLGYYNVALTVDWQLGLQSKPNFCRARAASTMSINTPN
jgi:hypothetical protein